MAAKRGARWLAVGGVIAALGACDAVDDRLQQFGALTGDVLRQITGEDEVLDPLTSAPLEARALFGVMQAPVELAPVSLGDLAQPQTFYAVGSIIAMPKDQIAAPVVEPESFDLAAAAPAAPEAESAQLGVAAIEPTDTADTALSASAEAAAGAPVVEAAPEPLPPPPPPAGSAAGAAPRLAIRTAPMLKSATPTELRQQAQIAAPRALEEAVKDSGVTMTRESLRTARATAEKQILANSETAQSVGDEVARRAADSAAPMPKALAVRSKLNVDAALSARQKAQSKLEQLGLSGIVSPEESGQMRITIRVNPTQLGARLDAGQRATMRSLFAEKKNNPTRECAGYVTEEQMQADAVLATECVVKALRETGDYVFVEKDYIFSHQMLKKPKAKPLAGVPNDPLFGLQWHYKTNGTAAGQSAGGASFADYWTRAKLTGSRDVTVAVIDTGLQMNHPDIKGSANLARGFDMVSDPLMGNDGDGRDSDPNDPGDKCDLNDATTSDTFHGTHVAGTIGVASTNNASGIAGGAWNVTIVPVRALGRCGGKLSDINDAIRWAAGTVPARIQGAEVYNSNPADIINLSIGLFEPCPASMQAAIDDAVAAGAIVVAAAGNARVDAKYFAPGGCRNVVSVAANDARGQLTPYSNFGANVAIMAPGGDMTRDDDKDGRPDGVLSTKYSKDCYDPAKPGTQVEQCYYAYENGTSMAAPHVSAALALIKAKFPNAVPSDLRAKLLSSTNPRSELQCSGKCSNYPGTKPIPGSDGMCLRPCGGAMLNLANAPVQ